MINVEDLVPINPKTSEVTSSAAHVDTGAPIAKAIRVYGFSPDEWESFTEEWALSLDGYSLIRRFSGAGDKGVDIAAFLNDEGWAGGWDNYQCKHYDHALYPSNIWVEIGKIIYYSFKKEYTVPRKYYFVAPKGIGTTLQGLFANPESLKTQTRNNWDAYCKDEITSTVSIPLEDDLLDWFEEFDFSIFSSKSISELIIGHAKTPFHAVKFGGGLPPRPKVVSPPKDYEKEESRYIEQLFGAYSHHLGISVKEVADFSTCANPKLKDHFLRQRERFYHAESLRNFARDTVPEGTFENLQEEIYQGVIDLCECQHKDGLERMRATLSHAGTISLTANPLKSAVEIQDRQGICHQLANTDRLIWVSEEEAGNDGSI